MTSDHIVYLTSSGNLDIFPNNNPGRFINRLSNPIILDNNINYEVGLISILYPDQYYGILAGVDSFDMEVSTQQKGKKDADRLTIQLKQHILAGNLENTVKIVNDTLMQMMEAHYHGIFHALFPKDEKILKWNDVEKRVEISRKGEHPSVKLPHYIEKISVEFKQRLAPILGFRKQALYTIYDINQPREIYQSPLPPSPKCGVDYIYMYADIIQPSNFGGQLVNILDCFTLQNGGNKGIHNSVYKTLNTSFIDQISIDIRDQKGRRIYFVDDSTLTCALHIRPK